MMNGVTFGNEGPVMQGTWYNPTTGDAFVVRDSFFEDNQYVVTTTDGRYLKYSQLQNYIQSDMSINDLKKMKQQENIKKSNEIPPEVQSIISSDDETYNDYMIPEDNNIVNASLGNLNNRRVEMPNNISTKQHISNENINFTIIDKALSNTVKPKFEVNLNWDDYPKKEIELLKDVMNISKDEIIDWYLDNITIDEIIESIKLSIISKINFEYKENTSSNNE